MAIALSYSLLTLYALRTGRPAPTDLVTAVALLFLVASLSLWLIQDETTATSYGPDNLTISDAETEEEHHAQNRLVIIDFTAFTPGKLVVEIVKHRKMKRWERFIFRCESPLLAMSDRIRS